MLRLSNRARYAVRALDDLALGDAGVPSQVRDVAGRQRIPLRFLERIFQELKRAGQSTPGSNSSASPPRWVI